MCARQLEWAAVVHQVPAKQWEFSGKQCQTFFTGETHRTLATESMVYSAICLHIALCNLEDNIGCLACQWILSFLLGIVDPTRNFYCVAISLSAGIKQGVM